jgi:phosphoglycerate dehydrogenase-like enzyme
MTDTTIPLLISARAWQDHGAMIAMAARVEPILYEDGSPPLAAAAAKIAFLSRDLFDGGTRDRLSARFMGFVEGLRTAAGLRWLHVFSAGADLWVYREFERRGVRLTTSAGATSRTVAQSAIAGLLALARQFPRCAEAQRRHSWEPLQGPGGPRSLDGQRALIVGTGPIGQEIARLCTALGLTTLGVRRASDGTPPPHFGSAHPFAALHDLLPVADWLILACPLTETTRGLIDAVTLARLPPGAHLINVARGPVVVEDALTAALRSGALAGAMLDVFCQEPLPPDSPFWDMPNIIITPHSAAASDSYAIATARVFASNLSRWAGGQHLLNEVKPVLG